MKQIGLYQAKTRLSALVSEVESSGQTVALTKHGKVVAEISPPSVKAPQRGMLKSADFSIAADFDDDSSGFEDFFAEEETEPFRQLGKVAENTPPYPNPGRGE